VAIAESHVVRMARTQRADAHGFGDGAGGGARQPHDADAAGARWRGDGDDGVGGGWESGHGSGNERSVVAVGSRKSEVGEERNACGRYPNERRTKPARPQRSPDRPRGPEGGSGLRDWKPLRLAPTKSPPSGGLGA